MRGRLTRHPARRQTNWATGLSVVTQEVALEPIRSVSGPTFSWQIDFTNAAVQAQHGGEGTVVTRLLGKIVPAYLTKRQDDESNELYAILRWAFVCVQHIGGSLAVPDLFDNEELGSERIMFMRQHEVSPLQSDLFGGRGFFDDRRVSETLPNNVLTMRPRARHDEYTFDCTAKRKIDEDTHVALVVQAQDWAPDAPDPERFDLAWSAYVRMLVTRPAA